MPYTRSFAAALEDGFQSSGVAKRISDLNRPSYVVGDGTAVYLGDHVRIPEHVDGRRRGEWGEVVALGAEGLGIRFKQKFAGITRELFDWDDLRGARATAISRQRKRVSVIPPVTI